MRCEGSHSADYVHRTMATVDLRSYKKPQVPAMILWMTVEKRRLIDRVTTVATMRLDCAACLRQSLPRL